MDEFEDSNDNHSVDDINYRKLHDKLTKVGYADGIASGRDSVFQCGFDQGYIDGLKTGLQLEAIQSFFNNLDPHSMDQDLVGEKQEYENLNIAAPTSRAHFKYLAYKDVPLEQVTAAQVGHLQEIRSQFCVKLPKTMELFTLL